MILLPNSSANIVLKRDASNNVIYGATGNDDTTDKLIYARGITGRYSDGNSYTSTDWSGYTSNTADYADVTFVTGGYTWHAYFSAKPNYSVVSFCAVFSTGASYVSRAALYNLLNSWWVDTSDVFGANYGYGFTLCPDTTIGITDNGFAMYTYAGIGEASWWPGVCRCSPVSVGVTSYPPERYNTAPSLDSTSPLLPASPLTTTKSISSTSSSSTAGSFWLTIPSNDLFIQAAPIWTPGGGYNFTAREAYTSMTYDNSGTVAGNTAGLSIANMFSDITWPMSGAIIRVLMPSYVSSNATTTTSYTTTITVNRNNNDGSKFEASGTHGATTTTSTDQALTQTS